MRSKQKTRQRGASTVEACVALPVVFLSIFGAFAIAESFFVASKMVHLSTGAAISLRATAAAGERITWAPLFNDLTYSPNSSLKTSQMNWYQQGESVTGFTSSSLVHRMFLNLFLGTLVRVYPDASSPPPLQSGSVNLRKAVEAKLVAVGSDTELRLRTAPVLANAIKGMLFLGQRELIFSTTSTIADMDLTSATDSGMDDSYAIGAGGGGYTEGDSGNGSTGGEELLPNGAANTGDTESMEELFMALHGGGSGGPGTAAGVSKPPSGL